MDDLLRAAIAAGMRGLTLWPCEIGWQANVTSDGQAWRCCADPDPAAAIRAVLADRGEPMTKVEPETPDFME